MRKSKSQTGSVHSVLVVVLVVVLIGALGFVFWNNFLKKEAPVAQQENKPKTEDFCISEENVMAQNGIFCSKEIGVKFAVPSIFANKLAKADNYEVFEGLLDPNTKKSAGMSEGVYRASISGSENFTLTVAQEPLRTGYVDVPHALQNTYYNQATGELTRINTPTRHYNSATDSYTVSGEYSIGEVVPSFDADGIRFFKGSDSDAGQTENVYFGVVNNKILKISLKHTANPAVEPANNVGQIFTDLDTSMKALKVTKL